MCTLCLDGYLAGPGLTGNPFDEGAMVLAECHTMRRGSLMVLKSGERNRLA